MKHKYRFTKISDDNWKIEHIGSFPDPRRISWDYNEIRERIKDLKCGEYYEIEV